MTPIAESNPFRPFCSERCKLLDLGDWLSERHRIPDNKTQELEEESQAPDDWQH